MHLRCPHFRCRHPRRCCRRSRPVPLCRCALVRCYGASASAAPARHGRSSPSCLCPRCPGCISLCEHSPNAAHSVRLLPLTSQVISIPRSVLWQIRFVPRFGWLSCRSCWILPICLSSKGAATFKYYWYEVDVMFVLVSVSIFLQLHFLSKFCSMQWDCRWFPTVRNGRRRHQSSNQCWIVAWF